MENAEEILQCLDEFSKLRPKEIPPELEYYLSFVARTGDPVYQWPLIKCLFREKLINVITEFYEACPSVEIPPCPNVEVFNYEAMKNFILEKLDTFAAAPFTVQRICELLTAPRKEYNRIDKYMRALEKNILVVSTREPGNRKSTENGESVVNGLESEHSSQDMVNSVNSDINVEVEMDDKAVWPKTEQISYAVNDSSNIILESSLTHATPESVQESYVSDSKTDTTLACSSSAESVITTPQINYINYTETMNELMVEEPTTNISNNEDTTTTTTTPPQIPAETNEVPIFNMSSTTPPEQVVSKEEEQQQQPVFIKADCSDTVYSSQVESSLVQLQPPIISETETEPITPPEPEEQPEDPPNEEPVVHSQLPSSPQPTPEAPTEEKLQIDLEMEITQEPESTTPSIIEPEPSVSKPNDEKPVVITTEVSNESTISSTDEIPQSSDDTNKQNYLQVQSDAETPEISGSSDVQVSESNIESDFVVTQTEETTQAPNIVIGPEDMQVEDISPEPEPTENSPVVTETTTDNSPKDTQELEKPTANN